MNGTPEKQERTWAMLCHLSIFSGHFIPLGNIIAPLVIWLVKKEESPFVDYHGKESLNFQISLTIYFIVAAVLAIVLIGFVILAVLWVFGIIVVIIAGLKANEGQYYRYPLTMRFIK